MSAPQLGECRSAGSDPATSGGSHFGGSFLAIPDAEFFSRFLMLSGRGLMAGWTGLEPATFCVTGR
ncbi:MAG TPA: hypothetical protein VFB27_13365, partial [Opitutaceae bacterium]|nr:hypothetical protein [Opitutaceae bacterium]